MRISITVILATAASATPYDDLRRARQQVPGSHVVGADHVTMTMKLNAALRRMKDVKLKACDEFSVEELISLQRKLYAAREPSLEAVYRKNEDSGRRMGAFGVYTDDQDALEKLWAKELETLKSQPALVNVSRDTKCHEAIMWLAHHVPQRVHSKVVGETTLPLLPQRQRHAPPAGIAFPPGGLGCDEAHASQSKAKNTKYVEWPEELTYTALGHGAFPFWDNGGPGCSHCDPSVSNSATLKVRLSAKQNAEIIMHEKCGDMTWAGTGAPDKSPCNHIFTPDKGAFIYTPSTSLEPEADGKFCCRTVKAGSSQFPGAVPRDWMKTGTYAGSYASFRGDHYSGSIEMFEWSAAGLYFWYYTQPDGTPVQQGEGCQQPKGKKPKACDKMLPIVLYHDFDPATFKNASFTSSDFQVPDVCTKSTMSCSIPGGSTDSAIVV